MKITNTSNQIAFFIEMKLKYKQSNEFVLPVFWSDNYISVLPNETKTITVEAQTMAGTYVEIASVNIAEKLYR